MSPFQSTPPEWGATLLPVRILTQAVVSIHAPRVGSDSRMKRSLSGISRFNPRPPSGERLDLFQFILCIDKFQSTPPEWGATLCHGLLFFVLGVSIHAPRVGSDHGIQLSCSNFGVSIHAPRVGSDELNVPVVLLAQLFQSTPPEWGATLCSMSFILSMSVSIHAPRVGSDSAMRILSIQKTGFNPRPPSGERLKNEKILVWDKPFQSTPPEWGATRSRRSVR